LYLDPTDGGIVDEVILEDEDNEGDGPPQGCACANGEVEAAISLEFGMTQDFVIDGTHIQLLQDFRDLVFEATEERCEALVAALALPPDADNCSTILVPGTTVLSSSTGTCMYIEIGPAGDEWSDYYSLGSVISLNPTNAVYEIDMAFFEDVVANSHWLFADSTTIESNGTSFQFYNVTSGDIVHALGIQSGYIPLTLNGMNVTNLDEAAAAMVALRYETEFTLVLRAGTSNVTRNYEIVP
jgi:hypothetical protein